MGSLQDQLLAKMQIRRTVHITLVGGQAAPVYYGIIATQPHLVEFIYSEQTAKVVDSVKAEIGIECVDSKPLSVTNPVKISKRAMELAEKYKDDDVVLNISSGIKPWSHLFGMVFQNLPNARVIYIDQNNVVWDFKEMKGTYGFQFDMFTLFRLYNNPLVRYTNLSEYNEDDDVVLATIERIRSQYPAQFKRLFLALTNSDKETIKQNIGKRTEEDGSFVEWDKSDLKNGGVVRMTIHMENGKKSEDVTLQSPHAHGIAFNAGWFELKVAKFFSQWENCHDVLLNCSFPAKNKADKNEVDIIVNAGTKIFFVECKTQIHAPTDIDKFRSVVRNYGGMGSKGVFVTDAEKKSLAKEKCMQNGILDISFSESEYSCPEEIFKVLNKELGSINAK